MKRALNEINAFLDWFSRSGALPAAGVAIYLLPVLLPLHYLPLGRGSTLALAWLAYRAGRTRPLVALGREATRRVVHLAFTNRGGVYRRFWLLAYVVTHPQVVDAVYAARKAHKRKAAEQAAQAATVPAQSGAAE